MDLASYRQWLGTARRFSRREDEAEDLLQHCLAIAVEHGRCDLAVEENRRWLTGVLRNQAAMTARGAVRRKQTEAEAPGPAGADPPAERAPEGARLLRALPPAARRVAALALHGLGRREILYLLELSPEALRQRLTTIRKTLGRLPREARQEALALSYWRQTGPAAELEFGLIRRALSHLLKLQPGVGTSDPDGHLLMLRPDSPSQSTPRRQRRDKD